LLINFHGVGGREGLTLRTYIFKRIVICIFVLWIVATLNFALFGTDPMADIFEVDFWGRTMDPNIKEMLIQSYGTYGPLFYRYLCHLRNMFTYGLVPPYFGWSSLDWDFVSIGMSRRLPVTLALIGTSFAITVTLGILIGVFTATKQGTRKDLMITASSAFTWSVSIIITALMAKFIIIYLFRRCGILIFPVADLTSMPPPTGIALYADIAWHLTLPIMCLVMAGLGSWILRTRGILLDALTQDFISTAHVKGVSERAIAFRHAFKSVLPQISTMIASSVPALITGNMIIESIFQIEGIGNWYIKVVYPPFGMPVRLLDTAATQAIFFIYANLAVVLNLIADIIYGIFDPRIRVGVRR